MANPGYPMQPMQPPMGGPQGPQGYGGPPPMMRPPQMRQGTSKAVPVVVSAGLAVGVFCGLLFGLGTGEDNQATAAPADKKFVGEKNPAKDDTTPTAGSTVTPPKSVTDGTGTPNTGSAATPAAGSAATVAKPEPPPPPTIKVGKLTVDIKPDSIASGAKITIDGTEYAQDKVEIDGKQTLKPIELPLGDLAKKEVKVVVKANGYKDVEQKVEVESARDTTLQVELVKKTGRLPRPESGGPRPKKPPKKPPGGGLIDI